MAFGLLITSSWFTANGSKEQSRYNAIIWGGFSGGAP